MGNRFRSALSDDGTATVIVVGEVDFANCDDLSQSIRDAVADRSPTALVVDVRGATFIDSTGLGALIEGYRAATDTGTRFVLANPSDSFRRMLTVTGLCELFGLDDTGSVAVSEATGA